ncbi:MAG: hypothetical protein QNI99_05885 [Woeseiaceae bacterium]|nr:hypothetical protein [Woeseiaceae bacterium]
MSVRAIKGAVIAAIAIVAAVLFWTTRQPEDGVGEIPDATAERPTVSDPAAPAASATATASERSDWFPDLSDSNGLTSPGTGRMLDTFGCDVDRLRDRYSLLRAPDGQEDNTELARLLSVLNASGDAEMLLAASRLGYLADIRRDGAAIPAERARALKRALATDPLHQAVLWDASQLCGVLPSPDYCEESWFRANLETVLGGNGAYWVREAVRRYRDDNAEGALAAVRRASSAPEFDNYVIEHTRILERALSAASDMDYMDRTLTAFAMSVGLFATENRGILTVCNNEADLNPEWRDACLELASRFLADGRTLGSREIGAQLQISLYRQSGQDELREAAEATLASLGDAGLDDVDDDIVSVMLTDERVLGAFLDEFEASDELAAVEWAKSEVGRLKEDPAYDPCPADPRTVIVE